MAATMTYTGVYRRAVGATPEIYVAKQIDNSRLVKVADPARTREMVMFAASLVLLFGMLMVYAWQHYSAIEYGYNNEHLRSQREQLVEMNRQLTMEEATLKNTGRIDVLARQMGLQAPAPEQIVRVESTEGSDSAGPVMARAAAISVISPQ